MWKKMTMLKSGMSADIIRVKKNEKKKEKKKRKRRKMREKK
jgi:hypothetical protein